MCCVLAALLHGTRAVGVSHTLRRGTRNGISEISLFIIFSERDYTLTVARPSVCLSVTLVHPTQAPQAVVIFRNISTAFGTLAIRSHPVPSTFFLGSTPMSVPIGPASVRPRISRRYVEAGCARRLPVSLTSVRRDVLYGVYTRRSFVCCCRPAT